MRVPVAWLRSLCDPPVDTGEVAHELAMSGTEVERVERIGVGETDRFVVGRVLEADRHPDADRLTVCVVDDGSGDPRTIVCGAPNVAAGQTVAVARPGAVMPDGSTLGEAELRGVRSSGMILAEDEVGVGEDHAGIMVLGDGAAPGEPLIDRLQIADEALELEVSPNRPDCLSVYGVAREVHAVTAAPLADDPAAPDADAAGSDTAEEHASVEIADPDICLRFTARVFCDVEIGPSPLWLKQRLTAAGQRPISNVVDITNYVMLLTGQPLHAFDLDEVRGSRIVVRRARQGETMTTLDGVERRFHRDTALVCDAEGPSGIAGIMGGQVSEVSERTTRVLMEAATWVGPNILRTSAHLGLRTEASARFEKQLHPESAIAAQRLAARLMVDLCGARLVPGVLDAYPRPVEPREVSVRHGRIERLLGAAVAPEEAEAVVRRLGFVPRAGSGERLTVAVPYWRDGDVQREADLIEEVARVHGVDRLPTTLPARRRAVGRLTAGQRLRRRLEDGLRDRGLLETVTYSFTSPSALERLGLDPGASPRITNPLSEEGSVMRPLLLPGLLDAARRNTAHGRPDVGLFESAHVYAALNTDDRTGPAGERSHLAALIAGRLPGSWRTAPGVADQHAARGVLEGVLGGLDVDWEADASGELAFLHPGRQAEIRADDARIGWLGEVHPRVAAAWDLENAVAFELDVDSLLAALPEGPGRYRDVSAFPAVLQDIAVTVPDQTSAADVRAAVERGGGDLLVQAHLFDLYRGEQVGAGRKSLALRLEFRAGDRTLSDEEVAALRRRIEAELHAIDGRLRA